MNSNLRSLAEENLLGSWEIIRRYPLDKHTCFFDEKIIFKPANQFTATREGTTIDGRWEFIINDASYSHPQMKFFLPHNDFSDHSIITGHYSIYRDGLERKRLALYFKSGLEVILEKD